MNNIEPKQVETSCTVRWIIETDHGWLGAFDRDAFASYADALAKQKSKADDAGRWYCINSLDMATLCLDEADARLLVAECDAAWPSVSPHRAELMVEKS